MQTTTTHFESGFDDITNGSASSESGNRSRPLGVALFGLGRAGRIHFYNVIKNRELELLWIVEEDVEKAEDTLVAERVSTTEVVKPARISEVLRDSRVDFVVVTTPTPTHEDIVRQSLTANKGVFCEKPVARSLHNTAALYDEADRVGRPLYSAFQRRFDPSLRSLHERVKQGDVGKLHVIKSCSRDSPLPTTEFLRMSGGIFHDCAVHDIDVICWMVGEAPTTAYATAHSFIPSIAEIGDVDTVAIVLKFPCGAIATVDLSRHAVYGYDQRVELFGDQGMIISENRAPTTLRQATAKGVISDPIDFSFPHRYREAYEYELEHFVDVMKGLTELEVTRHDALLAGLVADACELSYKTGQTVQVDMEATKLECP